MSQIDEEYLATGRRTADLPELLKAIKGPRKILLADLLSAVLNGQPLLESDDEAIENSAATPDSDS